MSHNYYHSAEVRWFFSGLEDWDKLLNWFCRGGELTLVPPPDSSLGGVTPAFHGLHVKGEPERIDQYLIIPYTDSTGIKQRQGKFEVKALVSSPCPWAGPHGLTGRVDQWVKWSFDSNNKALEAQLNEKLEQSGAWRAVAKLRYLQKYSFDSGTLVGVSPNDYPEQGCNVELTRINVNADQRAWISLGFETFGYPARVRGLLEEALDYFFLKHGEPPVFVSGHDSLNYPTWLALLR